MQGDTNDEEEMTEEELEDFVLIMSNLFIEDDKKRDDVLAKTFYQSEIINH